MLILSPPLPFLFVVFRLCYVSNYKLVCFLFTVPVHLKWPHHHLTVVLHLFKRACKCQLFTDESSRRLPKCLNYCFSILASATNQSIHVLSGAFIQPHLSLWCLHNSELAEHFNECHLGLHNCQSHANTGSRSTSKWDEGTRVDGGLAESAAEEGISMVQCSLHVCVYVCESVCIRIYVSDGYVYIIHYISIVV